MTMKLYLLDMDLFGSKDDDPFESDSTGMLSGLPDLPPSKDQVEDMPIDTDTAFRGIDSPDMDMMRSSPSDALDVDMPRDSMADRAMRDSGMPSTPMRSGKAKPSRSSRSKDLGDDLY